MARYYTPEQRAERRRRSSGRFAANALIAVQETEDSDGEASWIADLRAQGVDVDDFLKAAAPPAFVDFEIPEELRQQSHGNVGQQRPPPSASQGSARRMSRAQRTSVLNRMSKKPDINETAKKRFSQFLDKSYVFDETVGDMVINSLEEMTQKRWEAEVEQDSKNYDPSGTTAEKIKQNKKWALEMAHKRAAEAGYDKPTPDATNDTDSTHKKIYPKVAPPQTQPLPPIDERDFEVSGSTLNPREVGMYPPPLPYKLIDLVPTHTRGQVGIADGVATDGTYKEGLESCDSESMIVSCIHCESYLKCSREASLVRCELCNTVSPVCPENKIQGTEDDSTYTATSLLYASDVAIRGSL